MMMKNTRIIFAGLLLLSVRIAAQDVYFRHLGVKDGLTQVNIPSIYQDTVGVMWFGSSEGLNRFNGTSVKTFRPSQDDQGLTNNEINQLTGNRKRETLYIRSANDLIRFDLRTETFRCLSRHDINAIHCAHDTLWVLGKQSVSYYTEPDGKLQTYATFPDNLGTGMALYADKGTLWIATKTHLFKLPKQKQSHPQIVTPITLGRTIYKDSRSNLWVGTWKGLHCVSPDGSLRFYDEKELADLQVRSIVEDNAGNLWIGTFRGLSHYTPSTGEWKHYRHNDSDPHSLSHNSVLSLYKDRQGCIWIGTYFGGVNYFNPEQAICHYYRAAPSCNTCLSFPFVGKMTEDTAGNLWVCTEGGGLNCFNPANDTFIHYRNRPGDANSIAHNNLKCVYYRQENNRLYIGTHTGGLSVFDIRSGTFHTLRHRKGDANSLPNDIVNEVQPYGGRLFVLTLSGLACMDFDTETFTPLAGETKAAPLPLPDAVYETFLADSHRRLWLAKSEGGIVCADLVTGKVKEYAPDVSDTGAIGKFKVVSIYENGKGDVFFGSVGSGLFKYLPASDSFRRFGTDNHRLPADYCYYIRESAKDGNLMILHNKGVSVFDPDTEEIKRTYNLFQLNFCQGSSIYVSREGKTYIGGINGMVSFYEDRLFAPAEAHPLYFDRLMIYNKEVTPGDGSGILSRTLSRTPAVRLSHRQNNIMVEFCPPNYSAEKEIMYEYRLEGFDKEWIPLSSRQIAYTNLNPGSYTLVVREMNPDAGASNRATLEIRISSPFYATLPAYVLYALLLGGIMYLIVTVKARQAKLTASLEFERKENIRIEELNQTKLRFFTNISHEFRTPLTLIISQIELLLQSDRIEPALYNRIRKIYKNAWHMRNLISELLDFRKQEQGYLKLKVECKDLVAFTREIYMSFYEYAQKKHIAYRLESTEERVDTWFDPVQMQKVIFNLLSNAFKFTTDGGRITVTVRRTSSSALIEVKDTGTGIPREALDKIFDRFYQTGTPTPCFTLGSGIGLALTKGIVELHKGTVAVESSPGEGSTFTITLPLGNRHFTEDELSRTSDVSEELPEEENLSLRQAVIDLYEPEEADDGNREKGEEANLPAILIVEDNEELLDMLREIFRPIYRVHTARNGKEGWEQTRQVQPDLVLSDVMMPEMTGKELCYKIKNSVELAHIPVVLLTAQTSAAQMVEGYMFGADDYVTKPFNVKVLVARCNNLIRNKKLMRERYGNQAATAVISKASATSEADKQMMEKSLGIIRGNFDNPDFDVNRLASELGLGRSKLFLKFKEMTGLTPNEFILKVKLDEAMHLLKEHPELNISEISYKLGFSSARYFSKCFKAFYGIAPLNVRKG